MSDEEIIEEYVYEYWDCPKCGTKEIRGDEYKCKACGYPRDNSITFYRKEAEEKVEDKKKEEEFKLGPDWICSFCESLNSQVDAKCKGCGATREDSEKNYFDELKKREEKQKKKDERDGKTEEPPKEIPKAGKWWKIGAGAVGLLGILYSWGTCSTNIEYKVKSVSWIRAVEVERYQTENRSDWKGHLKGDSIQVLSEKREVKGHEKRPIGSRMESYSDTERVQSGTKKECSTSYKSTGSGASKKTTSCKDVPTYTNRSVTRTRSVPVYQDFPIYDTKVYYRSKAYSTLGYAVKKGKDNNPEWPKPKLESGEDGKKDRIGEKAESLQVTIQRTKGDKGPDEETFTTTEKLFSEYDPESVHKFSVANVGGISYKNDEKKLDKEEFEKKFRPILSRAIH
ncbi:MAG TPA: hypothetical protein PL163_08225 [Leptospiraceae bacterium]|nr:hypothetical protein [Leptospiraceae bacterium]HNM01733.1 hypothetical protein [Leptospiraceae bacterium]